ncbi:MAG: endonuclease/exonuclease/phosphatase family protein [Halioglobus sp.]
MLILFLVSATAIAILSLLPLSASEKWWVRCMDFPRLQLAATTFSLFCAALFCLPLGQLTSLVVIAITVSLLVYQLWWIAPYSRFFPVEVQWSRSKNPDNAIRILSANVLTTNRNAQPFIDLVDANTPDVVLTLESDSWWERQLAVLENKLPHTVKVPLDNLYGMHLYSRYPLSETEVKYLVEKDVPSVHTLIEMPSGVSVRAHFVHPAPPSPTENETSQERDAELILIAKSLQNAKVPTIVAGDLNDVAWSATTRLFRRISGLLDPRIGRGLLNTFHANFWFLRWPLDHIFHSQAFTLSDIRRLPKFGSDHFAIFTELHYSPDIDEDGSCLHTRDKDEDWAEQKLDVTEANPTDVPEPGAANAVL